MLTMMKLYTIEEIRDIVTPIVKNYGIDRMFLFGSYARGEATINSDIDFRIDRGLIRSYLKLGGLYSDLEEALNKKIDLVTTGSLSNDFLENISKEEIKIYDKC